MARMNWTKVNRENNARRQEAAAARRRGKAAKEYHDSVREAWDGAYPDWLYVEHPEKGKGWVHQRDWKESGPVKVRFETTGERTVPIESIRRIAE
jgi:hypothetical protein